MDESRIIEKIAGLFERRGGSQYGGEAVTQEEHALQAAKMAEDSGASPALIAAALLHDVGHLLHDLPDDAPDEGIDDVHEALGYRFLERSFGPDVAEPVRMHVAAKRYLCAVDSDYFATLSPPSVQSLALQGGPMTPSEVRSFEAEPFFRQSIELRRWDDLAKIEDYPTPPVAHYLSYLRKTLKNSSPIEALR